jgi:hypothetical protein
VIGWRRVPVEVSGLSAVAVAALFLSTVATSLFWMHRLG